MVRASMTLLSLEGARKSFNDRVLFEDLSLSIGDGERVGLLGSNGSGKSSLMRILAGADEPDEGQRVVRKGLRLGYLEQEPVLDPRATPREIVRGGLVGRAEVLVGLDKVQAELALGQEAGMQALLAKHERLSLELETLGGHDVEHRIESTLHSLDVHAFDDPLGPMSGGEKRRIALARLLLSGPELLLLDEPTNHLDAFVTAWLEEWFQAQHTPLLLVTHDRYFLDRVVDRIVELDRGKLWSIPGGYFDYLEARAARLNSEAKTERSRLNLLRRETAWMRRGPPARSTKAKARIQRYDALEESEPEELAVDLEFRIPPGPRLGSRVLVAEGISKSYGERQIVPPMDLRMEPGERIGIVGPNGAGKTTLIRMLLGELEPDTGEVSVGETVVFMGIDQMRKELNLEATVIEQVAGASAVIKIGDRTVRAESFLDKWGFPARMHTMPVGQLSGGERNRVLLAQLLCAGGNLLVLDEPTNDLDLSTLRALEEALMVFPGAVIVVSHDRWFLDRIATRILYLDGEGGVRKHEGDLSGLMDKLKAEKEAADGLAKRAAKVKKAASPAAPAAKPSKAPAKRLSNWEERELGELEGSIAKLEAEIGVLDGELAQPDIYSGPRADLEALQAKRAAADGKLSAAYERWEELESLKG